MSLMATGLKRPLPPPESHASVRQSCSNISDWDYVDNQDDLLIDASYKRQKTSSGWQTNSDTPERESGINSTPIFEAPSAVSVKGGSSWTDSTQRLDGHKKRLFQTDAAWKAAKDQGKIDSRNSQADFEVDNDFSPFIESGLNDSSSTVDSRALSTSTSEWNEADKLLRLTSTKERASKLTDLLPDDIDEASKIRRHREEELGRSRSRLMRQETLAMQQTLSLKKVLPESRYSPDTALPVSEKGNDSLSLSDGVGYIPTKMQADGVETRQIASNYQSHNEETLYHESELQIEKNLDICQAFSNEQNALPKVENENSLSKGNVQQNNPLSRSAAETFRTQGRHIEDQCDPTTSTTSAVVPSESALRRLLELRNRHQDNETLRQDGLLDKVGDDAMLDAWPVQGERQHALSLPVNFDHLDPQSQETIAEHERLKERRKDLESVKSAMQGLAMLGSVKPFDAKEREWMVMVKKFLAKVVTDNRSGRRMRTGIKQIADSVQRRLLKRNAPDPIQARSLLQALFQNYSEMIDIEVLGLADKIEIAGSLRNEMRMKRANEPKSARKRTLHKKKVPIPLSENRLENHDPHYGTRTEKRINRNRQEAQYKSQDQKLAVLRAQLSRFHSPATSEHEDSISGTGIELTREGEGYTSEEDEGAFHCAGAGIVEHPNAVPSQVRPSELLPPNDEEITRLSSHEQTLEESHVIQNKPNTCLASSTALDLPEVEHDVYFDDLQSQISTETFDGPDKLCYQYLVKEEYYNIDGFEENHEINNFRFLSMQKANLKTDEIVRGFVDAYRSSDDYQKDRIIRFSGSDSNEGLRDSRVQLGSSDVGGCHVWVDREDYCPNKEAYENAKVRRACNSKPVYWVLWTKTLKPLEEEEEDQEVSGLCEDGQICPTGTGDQDVTATCLDTEELAHETCFGNDRFASRTTSQNVNQRAESLAASNDDLFGPDLPSLDIEMVEAKHVYFDLNEIRPIQQPDTSQWNTMTLVVRGTREEERALTGEFEGEEVVVAAAAAAEEGEGEDEATSEQHCDANGMTTEQGTKFIPPETEPMRRLPSPPTTISTNSNSNSFGRQPIPSQQPPPPPPPPPKIRKVVQEVHFNDIQQFTTISTANRYAKEVFMAWYTGHLSSARDQAFVRNEESHMEDELRDYGNMTMWSREEDFVVDVSRGQQRREGIEHRAVESYKVWVERKMVRGPAN